MKNSKKIIVGKIPANRTSYLMKQNDFLISVVNGKVNHVIRGTGKQMLSRDENTEWYFVNGTEMQYELSYQGGNIQFHFSFFANAAFPTLPLHNKNMIGKDMTAVFQSWAASPTVVNTIADFLTERRIHTEKQLFESSFCSDLERRLLLAHREHFLKEWGMFLNSVSINRKVTQTAQTQSGANPYDYIF